jgi:hypothetical protein
MLVTQFLHILFAILKMVALNRADQSRPDFDIEIDRVQWAKVISEDQVQGMRFFCELRRKCYLSKLNSSRMRFPQHVKLIYRGHSDGSH